MSAVTGISGQLPWMGREEKQMAMAIELAKVMHRERLEEAETRRWRKAQKEQARKRKAATRERGPKVEWPVFSVRIGHFQFAVFRTVRL